MMRKIFAVMMMLAVCTCILNTSASAATRLVCPNCKEKYPASSGYHFCGKCGASLDSSIVHRKYEGQGFKTPEDAVRCYIEGLKNLDIEQMLSAFAWETQAEHYSLEAVMRRIKSYSPAMRPRIPSLNNFVVSANLLLMRSTQINSIYMSLEAFILGNDYPGIKSIKFADDKEMEAFLQKYNNGALDLLAKLSNIRFVRPASLKNIVSSYSKESNQKYLNRQNELYRANELVSIVGLADLEGVSNVTLLCSPLVARYGKKWYIVSVNSDATMFLKLPLHQQAFCFLDSRFVNTLIQSAK